MSVLANINAIRATAQAVCNGVKADVDLFECGSSSEIFEAVSAEVARISGGSVRIERRNFKDGGFPFMIQGPVAYCARIDSTGERKFIIGPYETGYEIY
jgi:hypothetical protein